MRPIKFIHQPVKRVCVCAACKEREGSFLFNYGPPFYPNQGRKLSQVLTGSLAACGESGNDSLYIQQHDYPKHPAQLDTEEQQQ